MKQGIVIADAGPIFSLAIVNKLHILDELFDDVKIPMAVWDEITLNKESKIYPPIVAYFSDKVQEIEGFNELTFIMDYGESESVILYKEINADILLIDDKKARKIAENFGVQCMGTIGLLLSARQKGIVGELRPIFDLFISNDRFYSIDLLNKVLLRSNEEPID